MIRENQTFVLQQLKPQETPTSQEMSKTLNKACRRFICVFVFDKLKTIDYSGFCHGVKDALALMYCSLVGPKSQRLNVSRTYSTGCDLKPAAVFRGNALGG